MSSKECLSMFSRNLFWDVDTSQMMMDTHSSYIIQRVLEYGQMKDWRLINRYYGLNKIVEDCKQMRSLDPVPLFLLKNKNNLKFISRFINSFYFCTVIQYLRKYDKRGKGAILA